MATRKPESYKKKRVKKPKKHLHNLAPRALAINTRLIKRLAGVYDRSPSGAAKRRASYRQADARRRKPKGDGGG